MLKRKLALLLIAFLLILAGQALAGEVRIERARRVALNWLSLSKTEAALDGNASSAIIGEEIIEYNNRVVGYNFLLSPKGHIVVPSKDELPVVKLYSYTSTLTMAEDNEITRFIKEELYGINGAIESHQDELSTVDHKNTRNGRLWTRFDKASSAFFSDSAPSGSAINAPAASVSLGPLLATTWYQDDPYNLYTPLWYNGAHTYTGCVATAAAQIMKYWNYPASGQGSTSYTWNNGQADLTITRDFSMSTYNWSEMTNIYGSGSTAAQSDAVARLMSDVGIAFQMEYGITGSGAYQSRGTTVFPVYFKYKNTIQRATRTSYGSDSAWMQVFKNEVQNGRPSQLGMFDASQNPHTGHSVVVDGYRDTPAEQIHINMGWSGSYDGWYVSNNIVTGTYHWTYLPEMEALINIEPGAAPAVLTGSVSNLAFTSATLNGAVNPNGLATSVYFKYGPTTAYENGSTAVQQVVAGTNDVPVAANIGPLTQGTTYRYQMFASNSEGTDIPGGDKTFAALSPTSFSLTVLSTDPASGMSITAGPIDNSGSGNGTTPFTRTYTNGTQVTLTAPGTAGNNVFRSWTGCNAAAGATCMVTMDAAKTVTATFISGGILSLSSSGGLTSSGPLSGPFSPSSVTYTLQNTGGTSIDWIAAKTQAWLTVTPASGTLGAGASATMTVSMNSAANSLVARPYSDTVSFTNTTNGNGNTTRPISLTVNPTPGALSVSSSGGLTSSGIQGGPFNPSSVTYTIQNNGGTSINWTASATQAWLIVTSTSGTLAVGASTTMTVTISSAAKSLVAGSYSDTITFMNTTDGSGNTTRLVSLGISSPAAPGGDLDNDGRVTLADALKALRIAAGIDIMTASDLVHGDVAPLVNGHGRPDGKIDINDVVTILRKAVGLPSW